MKYLLEDDENPVIDSDGTKKWYQNNNKLHRLDGPAEEWSNGTKFWYQNNKLHRLDGPAIEYANGDKRWYQNDQLHRLDGPAAEYPDGSKFWCQNDKCHRLDGPAVERSDGTIEWYINNKECKSIFDWSKKSLKLLGKPNDSISVQRYVSQVMANRIKSKLTAKCEQGSWVR